MGFFRGLYLTFFSFCIFCIVIVHYFGNKLVECERERRRERGRKGSCYNCAICVLAVQYGGPSADHSSPGTSPHALLVAFIFLRPHTLSSFLGPSCFSFSLWNFLCSAQVVFCLDAWGVGTGDQAHYQGRPEKLTVMSPLASFLAPSSAPQAHSLACTSAWFLNFP